MRVLFFTKMDFALEGMSGIRQKIRAQVGAFREMGHETDLLFREGNAFKAETHHGETLSMPLPKGPGKLAVYYRHMPERLGLAGYDAVFFRHHLATPPLLGFLKRYKRTNPRGLAFMEFPTFPYVHEYVRPADRLKVWIDQWCARAFRRYVDYAVTVTPETSIYGMPVLVMGNGIPVADIPFRPEPAPFGDELRLLGLANLQDWHGFDRLVEGMARYRANAAAGAPRIVLDVAGQGDELPRLQALVERHGLLDTVRFHGYRTGAALEGLVQNAHLGISTLALHRKQMEWASDLKSRAYCARGLPFVQAFRDEAFPEEKFPFVLRLPADDSPVDIERLLRFYRDLRAEHPQFPLDMRRYAEQHLTWRAVMAPIWAAMNHWRA
jgi:glycosyltransferase involved in cell wall biosynthesis